ncbi:NAD(P)H-hydrate epimerase [Actinomycetaceae bacterium L2_0104]
MLRAYRSDDVRAAESPLLEAGVPLMERAAYALAQEVIGRRRRQGAGMAGTRVLALVGSGNNGGDALFAAARLAKRGMSARALICGVPHAAGVVAAERAGVEIVSASSDAREAAELAANLGQAAHVWIDGLIGIGARGPLREPHASVVRALNETRRRAAAEPLSIAVDVPSGIGVDDGVVSGEVFRADVTVTMGAIKPGLLLDPGRRYAGEIVDVPLGLEAHLPAEPALLSLGGADIADLWDFPGPDSHKYTRGVVGLMTGSPRYSGAALLTSDAALAGGCGMVRYAGPRPLTDLVISRHPEVLGDMGRVQAWVLGSGVDMDNAEAASEVARRLEESIAQGIPVVLDAGAISLVNDLDVPSTVVLTPHAGELAQLLAARGEAMTREEIGAAPARAARLAATLTGATVLLKGSVDVACAPDDPLYAQGGAPAWRATAGAGDVLAGLLGAMLAAWGDELAELGKGRGIPARLAAGASYLHGRAAALASGASPAPGGQATRPGRPIRATEISAAIPAAIAESLAR